MFEFVCFILLTHIFILLFLNEGYSSSHCYSHLIRLLQLRCWQERICSTSCQVYSGNSTYISWNLSFISSMSRIARSRMKLFKFLFNCVFYGCFLFFYRAWHSLVHCSFLLAWRTLPRDPLTQRRRLPRQKQVKGYETLRDVSILLWSICSMPYPFEEFLVSFVFCNFTLVKFPNFVASFLFDWFFCCW